MTSLRTIAVKERINIKTLNNNAYTVLEIMIFLAVTSAIFVVIMFTFSGKTAKAEFATSTRELESRLQDIANDISSGYYENPGNFTCTVGPSGIPNIIGSASAQGTNEDCTFIGRVAQFNISGDSTARRYNLTTAIGARLNLAGEDANGTTVYD